MGARLPHFNQRSRLHIHFIQLAKCGKAAKRQKLPFTKSNAMAQGWLTGKVVRPGRQVPLAVELPLFSFKADARRTSALVTEWRLACNGNCGGSVEFHLDSLSGTLIASVLIPATGSWQTWTTATAPASSAAGIHDSTLYSELLLAAALI
jgi:Carbohydrate binding module (family 6)